MEWTFVLVLQLALANGVAGLLALLSVSGMITTSPPSGSQVVGTTLTNTRSIASAEAESEKLMAEQRAALGLRAAFTLLATTDEKPATAGAAPAPRMYRKDFSRFARAYATIGMPGEVGGFDDGRCRCRFWCFPFATLHCGGGPFGLICSRGARRLRLRRQRKWAELAAEIAEEHSWKAFALIGRPPASPWRPADEDGGQQAEWAEVSEFAALAAGMATQVRGMLAADSSFGHGIASQKIERRPAAGQLLAPRWAVAGCAQTLNHVDQQCVTLVAEPPPKETAEEKRLRKQAGAQQKKAEKLAAKKEKEAAKLAKRRVYKKPNGEQALAAESEEEAESKRESEEEEEEAEAEPAPEPALEPEPNVGTIDDDADIELVSRVKGGAVEHSSIQSPDTLVGDNEAGAWHDEQRAQAGYRQRAAAAAEAKRQQEQQDAAEEAAGREALAQQTEARLQAEREARATAKEKAADIKQAQKEAAAAVKLKAKENSAAVEEERAALEAGAIAIGSIVQVNRVAHPLCRPIDDKWFAVRSLSPPWRPSIGDPRKCPELHLFSLLDPASARIGDRPNPFRLAWLEVAPAYAPTGRQPTTAGIAAAAAASAKPVALRGKVVARKLAYENNNWSKAKVELTIRCQPEPALVVNISGLTAKDSIGCWRRFLEGGLWSRGGRAVLIWLWKFRVIDCLATIAAVLAGWGGAHAATTSGERPEWAGSVAIALAVLLSLEVLLNILAVGLAGSYHTTTHWIRLLQAMAAVVTAARDPGTLPGSFTGMIQFWAAGAALSRAFGVFRPNRWLSALRWQLAGDSGNTIGTEVGAQLALGLHRSLLLLATATAVLYVPAAILADWFPCAGGQAATRAFCRLPSGLAALFGLVVLGHPLLSDPLLSDPGGTYTPHPSSVSRIQHETRTGYESNLNGSVDAGSTALNLSGNGDGSGFLTAWVSQLLGYGNSMGSLGDESFSAWIASILLLFLQTWVGMLALRPLIAATSLQGLLCACQPVSWIRPAPETAVGESRQSGTPSSSDHANGLRALGVRARQCCGWFKRRCQRMRVDGSRCECCLVKVAVCGDLQATLMPLPLMAPPSTTTVVANALAGTPLSSCHGRGFEPVCACRGCAVQYAVAELVAAEVARRDAADCCLPTNAPTQPEQPPAWAPGQVVTVQDPSGRTHNVQVLRLDPNLGQPASVVVLDQSLPEQRGPPSMQDSDSEPQPQPQQQREVEREPEPRSELEPEPEPVPELELELPHEHEHEPETGLGEPQSGPPVLPGLESTPGSPGPESIPGPPGPKSTPGVEPSAVLPEQESRAQVDSSDNDWQQVLTLGAEWPQRPDQTEEWLNRRWLCDSMQADASVGNANGAADGPELFDDGSRPGRDLDGEGATGTSEDEGAGIGPVLSGSLGRPELGRSPKP
jgi:hypothetical protein